MWLSHNLNYFCFIISISGWASLSSLFLIFRSVLAILEDSLLFHYLFRVNFPGFTKNSVGLWSHIKSQGHLVKISISKHLGDDIISFQERLKARGSTMAFHDKLLIVTVWQWSFWVETVFLDWELVVFSWSHHDTNGTSVIVS